MPTTTTNKTTKLGLSQYINSDTVSVLTNYNSDMKAIDDAMGAANGFAELDANGKLKQMPSASDVGAAPTSLKINGYTLTGDRTLTANDVGAATTAQGAKADSALQPSQMNVENGIATIDSNNTLVQQLSTTNINALKLLLYPVNSIYFSGSATNPSTYFGGTWVAWGSGRVPIGVNPNDTDFNAAGKTGGAKTAALTGANNGPHFHKLSMSNGVGAYDSPVRGDGSGQAWTSTSNTVSQEGTGTPFSIMPPYITCYMWYRTA